MVQKVDTGHVYAMKILRKVEMFEKDQVRQADRHARTQHTSNYLVLIRLLMLEQNETYWLKQTTRGW